MKITPRFLATIFLGVVGAIAIGYGLNSSLIEGTCASGGPYVSAHPCTGGSPHADLALTLGIVILVASGSLGGADITTYSASTFVFGGTFLGLGIFVLVKSATSSNLGIGSHLGAHIIGAIFIPMGLAAFAAPWFSRNRGRFHGPKIDLDKPIAFGSRGHVSTPTHDDPRLADLEGKRSRLEITRAEYQQQKAAILGDHR